MTFRNFCKVYCLDPKEVESSMAYELWLDSLPIYTDGELEELKPKKIGDPYVIEVDDAGFQFLSMLLVILGALIYAVCF